MKRTVIVLFVAAFLAACSTPVEPTPVSPPTFRIAFTADRDGNYDIYVINADGTGQTRLTDNPADDDFPAWSPDGTRIAFVSERDGNPEIYVINADGSGLTRLTHSSTSDAAPDWSPDGRRIAFVSDRDGNTEIYVMPAPGPQAQVSSGGSDQTRLTDNPADDLSPVWSPDGSRIAFHSNRDGNFEIYVMPAPGPQAQVSADGSNAVNLTGNPADDWGPAWSPDGSRIAFYSDRDGRHEIYVMNADGSGQTNLTINPATEGYPAWSPDGSRIAFNSDRDGQDDIYVIDVAVPGGSAGDHGETLLTYNLTIDYYPVWSPDGRRIAFVSDRDGNLEIYVMNADGTGLTRLTDNPANDLYPAWSP